MKYTILHISDLHRDLADEVDNAVLVDSIVNDITHWKALTPGSAEPYLIVVSGDLVYGVKASHGAPDTELTRQYAQVEGFLSELANHLLRGDRDRVVIVPGNHDVSFPKVLSSAVRIEVPTDKGARNGLIVGARLKLTSSAH